MATDYDKLTIQLLRERAAKLEATLAAYDSMLNTGRVDALRQRNAELERALADVVNGGSLLDAAQVLLKVTIGNKVTPKH